MADKMTRIYLPGMSMGEGYMDHGERSAEAMINIMRLRADHMRDCVALIDAADDTDFQIDVVRGPYVQHHIREVQASRRIKRDAK